MAFTKVVGAGIHTLAQLQTHNIHSAGIITATTFIGNIGGNPTFSGDATFNGNVSIGGTLTYEDVKNVDSVGIVTAREGVIIPDNKALSLGNRIVGSTAGDLRLYHDGSDSYIDEIGSGNLHIRNGSDNSIFCQTDGTVKLYNDGTERLATTTTGVDISNTLKVAGVSTFHHDVTLRDAWGYDNHIKFHYGNNTLNFPSASLSNIGRLPKLSFGDRTTTSTLGVGDFLMYHDYYNMHMKYFGANGHLVLSNKNTNIQISGANGSGNVQQSILITAGANEGVKLYNGGNYKFETVGYGISVFGTTGTQQLNVTGVSTFVGIVTATDHINIITDNKKLQIGAGQDLALYHDGTNSRIHNTNTGSLIIRNEVQDADVYIQGNDGGSNVSLLAFDTSETGMATLHGELNMRGTHRIKFNYNTGNGNFESFIGQRFTSNSFNFVINNQQNNIFIENDNVVFRGKSGQGDETLAQFQKGGASTLHYGGSPKISTASHGINITGGFVATADCSLADKLTHAGDENTAIRFPAADTISFETAGNESFRIDSIGRLLHGTTSSLIQDYRYRAQIQRAGSNALDSGILGLYFTGSSGASAQNVATAIGFHKKESDGGALANNGGIGILRFNGFDGSNYIEAATIGVEVDGSAGTNDMPGRIEFSTTADGASSPTERLRITSDGKVGINTNDPQKTLDVYGNIRASILYLDRHGSPGINITSTSDTGGGAIYFGSPASGVRGGILYNHDGDVLKLRNIYGTSIEINNARKSTFYGDIQISKSASYDPHANLTIQTHATAQAEARLYFKARDNSNNEETCYIEASSDNTADVDLKFATNNSPKLYLHSNGYMSLGSAGAPTKFGIRGSSATTDATMQIVGNGVSTLLLGQNARGGVIRGQGAHNELSFRVGGNGDTAAATGGIEALRIDSGGGAQFVSQGTSIPVAGILHHTNNNLYVRGGTNGLILGNQDNTNTIQIYNSYIKFETNDGTEKLRIDSSGQVSIGGNSTVGTKLHIENDSGDAHIRLRASHNCGVLYTRHSDGALIGYTGSGNAVNLGSSNLGISASLSGGDIVFQTGGTASSNERARITSSGNIQHSSASGVSYFTGSSEYIFGSTTSSPPAGGFESPVQIHTSKTRSALTLAAYNNNTGGPFMTFITSRSTTRGQLGSTIGGADTLGQLRFCGDNGTNYNTVAHGATISATAKSAPGSGDTVIAGEINFDTGSASGGSFNNVLKLRYDQQVEMTGAQKVKINGVIEYYAAATMRNDTAYDFDFTVRNEGGYGNSYYIVVGYNHFHTSAYGAQRVAIVCTRGTALTVNADISNVSHSQAGAWSFSKPNSTTLRITKSAGTYGGTGYGFIRMTGNGNTMGT